MLATRSSWLAGWFSGPDLRTISYEALVTTLGVLRLMMFWIPLDSLPDWIVPFLMSTPWIVPFRICLPVMTVAATALPAQAATRATIEMMSAGLGRRSFMNVSPCVGCLPVTIDAERDERRAFPTQIARVRCGAGARVRRGARGG